jgi:anti-anti-sigma factor
MKPLGVEHLVTGIDMQADETIVVAPEELGLETRSDFRRAAMKALADMPEGNGRLIVDLSTTRTVDSAGLSSLILVQRRAASRRQVVRLRGVSEELRFLLVLTKLEDLFEVEGPTGSE